MKLPPLIKAMTKPEFYPHNPLKVELVQTHISYVFLAGELVYKVKKPVDFGFLNFTTLRRRGYYCRLELSLNRRLAPDLYISVARITDDEGRYSIDGRGRVVEYAVVMHRVPDGDLLVHRLAKGRVTGQMMRELASLMARFLRKYPTAPAKRRYGSMATLRRNTEEDFDQTRKYIGRTVTREDYDLIAGYTRSFIHRQKRMLRRRVAAGRIRDGHGDLHAEHVGWRRGKPFVFDCIEFAPRFRCADAAAEAAFLVMDLEYRGAYGLARHFMEEYMRITGDQEMRALLDFYLCYRAFVRGKINSFLVDDPIEPEMEKKKAAAAASEYFRLAAAYARRDTSPFMVVTTGLTGTGKSAVADILRDRLAFNVIRSDEERKRIAGIPARRLIKDGYRMGLYSPEMTARTYKAMISRGRRILKEGGHVILDATFGRDDFRREARKAAESAGARFRLIEVVCPAKTARERLSRRMAEGVSPSDGRWEIYVRQKDDYEAPDRSLVGEYSCIDTTTGRDEIYSDLLIGLYPMEPVPGTWMKRGR